MKEMYWESIRDLREYYEQKKMQYCGYLRISE